MSTEDTSEGPEASAAIVALVEKSRPAARVLQLLDVRVMHVAADLGDTTLPPPYDVTTSLRGGFGLRDRNVGVDLDYGFTAHGADGAAYVWRVELVLHLEYTLDDAAAMPEQDAIAAYAATAAPFMAHPFAREIVHSLTTRLGVAPFVLPVLRGMSDTSVYGPLEADAIEEAREPATPA